MPPTEHEHEHEHEHDAEPSVEVRQWAERVLFEGTIDAKLWAPRSLVDQTPGTAIAVPHQPGRAGQLGVSGQDAQEVPRDRELVDPQLRGRLLHMFANHELLAIELMALALLRFPEAPAAFRRGLVQALGEEQTHLGLYLDRMQALGVELGEQPLSGFFWRVMSPMSSPLDFVAHMALTFEQANLDFARHYALALRVAGDEPSAAVVDRVYIDEIGHVKLGLVWFERWRERGPSLFEAHRRSLRAPITPRRARGLGFDREGRTRAGFSDSYIETLSCFEASRGRRPVVHWFHPTAELELATDGAYTPGAPVRAMAEDLALLPAFYAAQHDVVLVRQMPSLAHIQQLRAAGLRLPQCVPMRDVRSADALPPRLAELRPWGWGPSARAFGADLATRTDQALPPVSADRRLHAKSMWAEARNALIDQQTEPWLDTADTRTEVVTTVEEACVAVESLATYGYDTVVLKAPFGTSGRNAQRVDSSGLTVAQRGWLARILKAQGAVVVEPWLARVCDLSVRITVEPEGIRVDEISRFVTDARGQYLGAVLGPLTRAVSSSVARWLHDDGRDVGRLPRVMTRVGTRVGEIAREHGYFGPMGIDALIYRDRAGALRLRPIVEVNVRPTFGNIVAGLSKRVMRGCVGLFAIVRRADLNDGLDPSTAIESVQRRWPIETAGEPAQLRRGVVALNDPALSRAVVALVVAAPTRDDALVMLESIAAAAADRLRTGLSLPTAADT